MENKVVIQLDKDWFVEDNGSGYTLYKWTGKTGKFGAKDQESSLDKRREAKIYDIVKYPHSFQAALELYARLKTVDSAERMTLEEYVNSIKRSYEDVCERLRLPPYESK